MRHELHLHPDSRTRAVHDLKVDIERPHAGSLVLRYVVTGATADLILPRLAPAKRTDELWKHTCFEVFIRASTGETYFEFNFSPSTQWAAYRFTGYRQGMAAIGEISAPFIDLRTSDHRCDLHVRLELDSIPGLPKNGDLRLGLTAIIEETGGEKSYWALVHPSGKPDFHHLDGFVLDLPTSPTESEHT